MSDPAESYSDRKDRHEGVENDLVELIDGLEHNKSNEDSDSDFSNMTGKAIRDTKREIESRYYRLGDFLPDARQYLRDREEDFNQRLLDIQARHENSREINDKQFDAIIDEIHSSLGDSEVKELEREALLKAIETDPLEFVPFRGIDFFENEPYYEEAVEAAVRTFLEQKKWKDEKYYGGFNEVFHPGIPYYDSLLDGTFSKLMEEDGPIEAFDFLVSMGSHWTDLHGELSINLPEVSDDQLSKLIEAHTVFSKFPELFEQVAKDDPISFVRHAHFYYNFPGARDLIADTFDRLAPKEKFLNIGSCYMYLPYKGVADTVILMLDAILEEDPDWFLSGTGRTDEGQDDDEYMETFRGFSRGINICEVAVGEEIFARYIDKAEGLITNPIAAALDDILSQTDIDDREVFREAAELVVRYRDHVEFDEDTVSALVDNNITVYPGLLLHGYSALWEDREDAAQIRERLEEALSLQDERESSLADETLKTMPRFGRWGADEWAFLHDPALDQAHLINPEWFDGLEDSDYEVDAVILARNLYFQNKPITRENVIAAYHELQGVRQQYADLPIFEGRDVIQTSHMEGFFFYTANRFGKKAVSEGIEAQQGQGYSFQHFEARRKNVKELARAKQGTLDAIGSASSPFTFLFHGHGSYSNIYLSGGHVRRQHTETTDGGKREKSYRFSEDAKTFSISVDELAKALHNRNTRLKEEGKSISDDILIISACFSHDFVRFLYEELEELGSDLPIIMCPSEYGQLSYDRPLNRFGGPMLEALAGSDRATIGSTYDLQRMAWHNMTVYVPPTEDRDYIMQIM